MADTVSKAIRMPVEEAAEWDRIANEAKEATGISAGDLFVEMRNLWLMQKGAEAAPAYAGELSAIKAHLSKVQEACASLAGGIAQTQDAERAAASKREAMLQAKIDLLAKELEEASAANEELRGKNEKLMLTIAGLNGELGVVLAQLANMQSMEELLAKLHSAADERPSE